MAKMKKTAAKKKVDAKHRVAKSAQSGSFICFKDAFRCPDAAPSVVKNEEPPKLDGDITLSTGPRRTSRQKYLKKG